MKLRAAHIFSLLTLFSSFVPMTLAATRTDVLVYGGTSAGITAAVQAARMGRTVILLEPGKYLGGMTTGGLGATDAGSKDTIGGIAREFYQRLFVYYQNPDVWRFGETYKTYLPKHPLAVTPKMKMQFFFEPSAADKIYSDLLADKKITVHLESPLDRSKNGVRKNAARIESIRTTDGREFAAKMFIDATYEGDLMAAAGAAYIVGREPNSRYGETLNGFRAGHRAAPISPFVNPGDPASGLLPRILEKQPAAAGEGDHRTQAYNFRVCLTDVPENKIPLSRPDNYNPLEYQLLLRHILRYPEHVPGNAKGTNFFTLTPMPNRKTDTNNKGYFSTDYIGANHDWPEASYEQRAKIFKAHEDYIRGLFWFMATDPKVPQKIRDVVGRWGYPKDEFVNNNNWPHQLYVREARRLVGEYVATELDTDGRRLVDDPVALASYSVDCHIVSLYLGENNILQLDGNLGKKIKPWPVSYRSLLPKRAEATNLLVPVACSASHVAYASIRMEPVFMMLGQSAATAACLSIDNKVSLHDLPYEKLAQRLKSDGQILHSEKTVRPPKN